MRDKQREETRRKLYHAALEVFRRDGFAGCRIDDIAQKAEVSRAAFYFHFPTKDDVLLELVREAEMPVAAALNELGPTSTLDQVMQTVVVKTARFWQNEPKLLVDALTTSLKHQTVVLADREAEPLRILVAQHFKRVAERGELSQVIGPEVLADFFLINCFAAMLAWSPTPTQPLESVLQGVIQLFLSGAGGPNRVKS